MTMFAAGIVSPTATFADARLNFGDIAGHGRLEVPGAAPCCVTGVVTYVASWINNSGIVASPDDINGYGIWFSGDVNGQTIAKLEGVDALQIGDMVEIVGTSSWLGFAPGIRAELITLIGGERAPGGIAVAMSTPPERRLRDFDWGVMDNRRATIRGVLMDAKTNSIPGYTSAKIATADGDFLVHLPGNARDWRGKVDAELLVSGIAMSIFNIRGEFIGVQMDVVRSDDVRVVKEPVPFGLVPEVALSDILPYTGREPDAHRRRVRGTVTLVKEGEELYLQSSEGALRVKTSGSLSLKPGDEVEAVGFPRIKSGLGQLEAAEVRKTGVGALPDPIRLNERNFVVYTIKEDGGFENYDARFVEFEARVLAVDNLNLFVAVGAVRFNVGLAVPLDADVLAAVGEIEPTLRFRGVLSILQNPDRPSERVPSIAAWRLETADASGAVLVKNAEWRAYRRGKLLVFALWCALGFVGIMVLVFVVRYIRFRSAYRSMDILAKERKRMACDLHDTIEQNLLAAKLLMQSAVSMSPDMPEAVKEAVESAQEILLSAKREVRETVFNLQSDEIFARRSEDVMRSVAGRLSHLGVVKVRTHIRGLPERLPGAMFSDIIHIIKEAVTNAVKHGHARNVIIVTDPAPGGGWTLRIANDGDPFDAAVAPGPVEGHFGLTGMRERAKRNGIAFSIDVEKGMTTVRLEVKK